MFISVSAEADYPAVVNELTYAWLRSDQPSRHRPEGRKTARKTAPDEIYSYTVKRTLKSHPMSAQIFTDPKVQAWLKFNGLVAQWRAERGATSSIAEMCSTPAYLSILGMGKEAIPFLLGQLRLEGDDPDHWFVALYHTAEVDPVPDRDKGNMAKMSDAWLKWAEQEQDAW